MARVHQAEAVGNGHEAVGRREAFYRPASLDKDPIFCGDDRNKDGIQLFGGVVNIAYNEAVLEEVAKPGSVTDSLEDRVEAKTAALIREGMHPGVHSDTTAEQGTELKEDSEGPVGCAYALLRAAISEGIGRNGGELVEEAARLRPELFEKPGAHEFGLAVTAAHGRLAERESFQSPGRKVVLAAASKGAKTTVYEGDHIAGDAIINKEPSTRFDGGGAMNEGLPAYNHDAWAAEEIARRLNDPSDSKQRQIANLIDMLGTVRALGVGDTLVRR
jgi:hypothetical protein